MKKVYKVLLVEDDEDDYVILRDLLNDIPHAWYELKWVTSGESALLATREETYDVIFLDYYLGGETGMDVLQRLVEAEVSVPFIMLTGKGDHEVDMAAMEAGAHDFISKGSLNAAILERAIRYSHERKRQSAERERLIGELQSALDRIKRLKGLIPICASCKSIRDDDGYWQQIESYIRDHSDAEFSHSICPQCVEKLYPGLKK